MSRIKKIIIAIIMFLLTILIMNTKSFADGYKTSADAYGWVGSTLTLTDFSANRNIVCLNHAQSIHGGGTYRIQAKINIEGNIATGHYNNTSNSDGSTIHITEGLPSKQNGILAYTVSNNGHPKRTQYGFNASDSFCMNMWREMYYWKTAKPTTSTKTLGRIFNVDSFIGTIRDPWKNGDYKPFNETLQREAEEYADSIGQWIVNSTGSKTVQKRQVTDSEGTAMTLIGPFKFEFPSGMEVDNSSNKRMIQVKWSGGESTSGNVYDANGNAKGVSTLKPNQLFYLRVSSGITGKVSVTIYINSKSQARCADLIIFKSLNSLQPLMAYYPYRETIYHHQKFSFTIDTETLIVQKLDRDTSQPLEGAKFIFQKVGAPNDGSYIKKDGNKISFTKNESEATVFTTDADGLIEITGLNAGGTYKVIEKETPQGYRIEGTIPNVEMGYNYTWDAIKSITYLGSDLYYDNLPGNKQLKDYISTLAYVIAAVDYAPDSTEVKAIVNDLKASGYYNTIMDSSNPGASDAKKFTNKYNLLSYVLQYLIDEKGYAVVDMTDEAGVKQKLNRIYRRMREKTGQTIVNMPASLQESYWKQWDKQANVRVVYNVSDSAGLIIKKYAAGTTIGLADAKFIVCTDVECTDVVASGTTSSTGTITVSGLEPGTYYIKETEAPPGYELSTAGVQKVIILSGEEEKQEVIFENVRKQQPSTGDGIIKVIKDTGNTPLPGMEFGVKNWNPKEKEYTKYKEEPQYSDYYYTYHYTVQVPHVDEEGNIYYTTENRSERRHRTAQYNKDHKEWEEWKKYYNYWQRSKREYVGTGVTEEDGLIRITLDDSSITEPGTYTLYEIGSENPYFNVRIGNTDVSEKEIGTGYEVEGGKVKNDSAEQIVENERTYVDIQGIVFIDEQAGKKWQGDGLYTDGEGVNGVKVTLKRNGTVIDTIESGKDSKGNTLQEGEYKFWGDRDNLKIETQYLDEYIVEFEYNGMKYQAIASNIGEDRGSKAEDIEESRNSLNQKYSTVDNMSDVEYDSANYQSIIKYNGDVYDNSGKYNVTASTSEIYNLRTGYNPIYNEIQNVNFGIVEREQPDLALVKDLAKVRLEINGKAHTYNYETKMSYAQEQGDDLFGDIDETEDLSDAAEDLGVKFGQKYLAYTYTRPVYKSDYTFTYENNKDDRELKAYLTYKITLKNQSTNLTSQVNSIVDYYDSRYELEYVIAGNAMNDDGTVNESFNVNTQGYNNNYHKATIETNLKLDAQSETYIYVQFKLTRQAIEVVAETEGNENLLENVAEINSYSTFEADGNTMIAGVDVDSKPGNAVPGNISTYEDDTDRAPSFKIENNHKERTVSGMVFIDNAMEEKLEDNQRIGSGIYEPGEEEVQEVKVTLIEQNNVRQDQEAITDENGNYSISGYIPGDYIIKYTWGNNTFYETPEGEKIYTTVQNYKGTVYDSTRDQTNTHWYKVDEDTRYTDALDDWDIREKIDDETSNITYKTKQEFNQTINEDYSIDGKQIRTLEMQSNTPLMEITLEDTEEQITGPTDEGTISQGYSINYVDFGIIERPKQILELKKRIKHVEMKLSNDVTLIDAEIDENGNIIGQPKYIQYIPKEENDQNIKQVLVQINDEISQDVETIITYELKANNLSERDYCTREYYWYGDTGIDDEHSAKLAAKQVIDYIDNDLLVSEENNSNCQIQEKQDKEDLIRNGYLTEELQTQLNDTNNVVITPITDPVKQEGQTSEESPTETPTENGTAAVEISAGQSATTEIITYVNLSTNRDIDYENFAEIIEVGKTYGSVIITTPGNYVPGNSTTYEPDNDEAEHFTVIPPTGVDYYYIPYFIIGICSLGILVAGIVIIKKYVLK